MIEDTDFEDLSARLRPSEARAWAHSLKIAAGVVDRALEEAAISSFAFDAGTPPNLIDVAAAAERAGLTARLVRVDRKSARDLPRGSLILRSDGDLVVLDRFLSFGRVRIYDAANGWHVCALREAITAERAAAIELVKAWRNVPNRLTLLHLAPKGRASIRLALEALAFSMFLQCYFLASPMLLRIAIDDVAMHSDRQLLDLLAVSFVALAILNATANALRGYVTQQLNSQINWEVGRSLFEHLLKLPLRWFQGRPTADILDRLQAVDQARGVFSGSIAIAIDGLLSVGLLLVLFATSPVITAVALFGVLAYFIMRLFAVPLTLRLSQSAIAAAVSEHIKRLEIVRAIQSIKAMGAEMAQRGDWQGRFHATIMSSQATNVAASNFTAVNSAIVGLASVAAVYVGARQTLEGDLTIGAMVAATAYLSMFIQRATSLLEQFFTWRTLRTYLDRLAEIASAPAEDYGGKAGAVLRGKGACIELRDVSFRYGPDGPDVLDRVNLQVASGDHLAIVGPSGSGKSTLLKVISSLYAPTVGEVRLNSLPYPAINLSIVRRAFGVVMQDDELLDGTVLENVTFFERSPDIELVWACLDVADIMADIQAMPDGIATYLGEAGRAISGGQRQRILIARALYRRPMVLLMDEATSHVDVASETRIAANLGAMKMTRIVIAHRPQTIAAARRVLRFEDGRLHEVPGGAAVLAVEGGPCS
ncbi:MAG: peptidase domain-containing ABC transporter [Caulobacter sp.]|nr:peptidase domain-containing ABC transporter [Caulobacter sp.]